MNLVNLIHVADFIANLQNMTSELNRVLMNVQRMAHVRTLYQINNAMGVTVDRSAKVSHYVPC